MLDQDQKRFIKAKVGRLGTMEAVRKDYRRDDLVSQYAHKVAERMYESAIQLQGGRRIAKR